MEFRQLRYFLAVLQFGSINRAAASLNVAQPSLSHGIKSLERSVGAELLVRSGGGVRPTAIGIVFERYARSIVREAEKALNEVADMRGAGRGKVSIGVMSVFSCSFMPRVLGRFFEGNNTVEVETHIFTSPAQHVIKKLQAAEWDMALTLWPAAEDLPSDISARLLRTSRSHVYCSIDHPLAHKAAVSLDAMADYEWAVTNVGSAELLLNEVFNAADLQPRIRMRASTMNLVLSMASNFPFLVMAPEEVAEDEVERERLVRVDQSAIRSQSQIAIFYSNLSERTSPMKTLMALCAAEAAGGDTPTVIAA